MMSPEEEGGVHSALHEAQGVQTKATEQRLKEEDNQRPDAETQRPRDRRQSDAERRDEREEQRATQQQARTRSSLLHNRFLLRKDAHPKRNAGKDIEPEDDGPEEEGEEEADEKVEKSTRSESALVVTRKRSSAASSAVKETAATRGRHQSSAATRQRAEVHPDELLTTPSPHLVPSLVLKRSKWTKELDEDEACGLFVAEARKELSQIASSTLVRLEERLRREFQTANKENDDRSNSGGAIRLNELVHSAQAKADDTTASSGYTISGAADSGSRLFHHTETAPVLAALEITVDRLVLDDHAHFSLADRIETQLRSLHASYTQLIHAQPWQALRQRVDAFVDERLRASTATPTTTVDLQWLRQTQADAQSLLLALGTLQQLHYQLLTTWHELQDCYRQPALAARPHKLRVQVDKRAESLSLSSLQAFLELDSDASEAKLHGADETTAKLRKSLDALEIKDQYLHVVLRLETFTVDVAAPAPRPPLRYDGNAWSMLSACWSSVAPTPPPPQLYVALFINDKEVGRTRAATWMDTAASKGSVVLRETLRTQLQYFPDSAAVKVFERGLLTDTLLSTTAIPLLVPGHDLEPSGRQKGGGRGGEDRNLIAAVSLSPSSEWYQFSSVHAIARSQWHATFLNSALFAKVERHAHGRVRVHVAWVPPATAASVSPLHDGDDDELLPPSVVVLPPRRAVGAAKDNAKLVGPRVDRRRHQSEERVTGGSKRLQASGFSYERDFLVHMNALVTVDRNDPQNAPVVRLKDHSVAQSTLLRQRDVFRTTALAYDALLPLARATGGRAATLTKRNYLLQLRDREHVAKHGTSMIVSASYDNPQAKQWDHVVFEEPLPLSEHEIATNATFLSLLRPEIPSFDQQQRLDDALAAGGDARVSLERQRKLRLLKIQDFVDRVRASHLVRVHNAAKASTSSHQHRDRAKTLASIIQEQPLPLLPGALDLSGLSGLFSRRRRLRPRVERRAAPQTKADWPRHCTLYVQIKGASNVPVRIKAGPAGRSAVGSLARKKPPPKRGRGGGAMTDDDDEETKQETAMSTPEAVVDYGHVFVEISFQGKRRHTTSTHVRTTGAVWMETLALPFHAPLDDWSPESLQKTPDVIRFSLFDQLVTASTSRADDDALLLQRGSDQPPPQQQQQQQQRLQSFHQENRFLGTLEIPFTTLYHNHGTLDATLRCEMPVVNAGYTNAKHATGNSGEDGGDDAVPATAAATTSRGVPASAASASAPADDEGVLQSSREATFLSVMLTLDPLLPRPVATFQDVHALGDDAALAAYAKQWAETTQSLNAATKRRDFHVFVRNLSHGQTFLTRYLTPQTPPATAPVGRTWTVQQLVRFVRLVPFLDDWNLFDSQSGAAADGALDVWTTSQELLELNAGDEEEHAVLLCNLLNWLDRQEPNRRSFLVLADGVPQGKTVYVLRQDSYKIPQRSVLWQASAGVGYSVLDDRCPVLDVSLVVSSDNIYANIQPRKRLSEMNWDVETNAKAWRPFFHGAAVKKEQFTLPSVQIKELQYDETPAEYVQQVELEIRETIKLEIRRWRSSKHTTTFNMDLSRKLRGQLERLETAMMQSEGGRANGHRARDSTSEGDPIQELLRTRRVNGMPLHTSFTDVAKVVAMVQNTHIYWNEHAEVEFGLAVYVHAYPNCILSVWVYLVAVEPLDY